MKRILLVEDEAAIREFVVINLKKAGFDVTEADSGEAALRIFAEQEGAFHVALLDIMMPGIDGLAVCRELRRANSRIGIIMLTAKTQEADKIAGLSQGADDYVTKPFSPSELVARVESLCRRVDLNDSTPKERLTESISQGDFVLNLRKRSLEKSGDAIELTQVEFQIMEYFFQNPDTPISRRDILVKVWGESYCGEEKIVDVNIRRLRMKIETDPSDPKHIITVWGKGYQWESR